MNLGTKSVLFGAHCFFIHPWFAALGWWRLYGFPWDPRLWLMFFVHDLGYWGKAHMDDEEGERHPEWGARVMARFCDTDVGQHITFGHWYRMSLYHSRFLAKRHGVQPSKFCAADKLAICFEPWWLYLPRVMLTGEILEYMADSKYVEEGRVLDKGARLWHASMVKFLRDEWIPQNQSGGPDTLTSAERVSGDDGVWR